MSENETQKDRLAARLRTAREMAGLSQGQVAKMLGLHRPSISEMEAGRRKVSAEEVARLAELYRVDIDWLTGSTAGAGSGQDDRVQLAAREFSKLNSKDLDRVMDLLQALRTDKGKKP
jgi:transcriptional regulator with XRE-family HTH domain